MKRSSSTEDNEDIFSKVPLEITYEIQSKLKIASLIQLGRTCKFLHQTQKAYIDRKEKEISDLCTKRMREDLEKKGLFHLLIEILPLFQCVIRGLYLDYYLTHDTGHPTVCIILEMPKAREFLFDALIYIHQNIDLTRYIACINFESTVNIIAKPDFTRYEVRIIHTKHDNVSPYDTCYSKFGLEYAQYTDLKKVYFKNVCQFLHSKESIQ